MRMTGAEILSLLKEGGYGLAVLSIIANVFLYRQTRAEQSAHLASVNTLNSKILDIAIKSIEADKDNQHAVTLLAKALESRPHV
jgi:hypothetical protein